MVVLRWVAFFIIGDLFTVVIVVAIAVLLTVALSFIGAVWDAGFDPYMTRILFEIRMEGRLGMSSGFQSSLATLKLLMILPGSFGGFAVARTSLVNDGWRFWRWRD